MRGCGNSNNLRLAELKPLLREPCGFSAIVFWEIQSLARQGRIAIDVDDPSFNRDLAEFRIFPITQHVCRQLRALDFTSDPADELIAATSVALNVPLVTRDERILRSRVVPFALPSD